MKNKLEFLVVNSKSFGFRFDTEGSLIVKNSALESAFTFTLISNLQHQPAHNQAIVSLIDSITLLSTTYFTSCKNSNCQADGCRVFSIINENVTTEELALSIGDSSFGNSLSITLTSYLDNGHYTINESGDYFVTLSCYSASELRLVNLVTKSRTVVEYRSNLYYGCSYQILFGRWLI